MSEENKTIELKEDELKTASGGGRHIIEGSCHEQVEMKGATCLKSIENTCTHPGVYCSFRKKVY